MVKIFHFKSKGRNFLLATFAATLGGMNIGDLVVIWRSEKWTSDPNWLQNWRASAVEGASFPPP